MVPKQAGVLPLLSLLLGVVVLASSHGTKLVQAGDGVYALAELAREADLVVVGRTRSGMGHRNDAPIPSSDRADLIRL